MYLPEMAPRSTRYRSSCRSAASIPAAISLSVACADEQCAGRAIPAALSEDLPSPVRPGPLPHMRGQLAQDLALPVRNRQVAAVGGRLDAADRPGKARAGPRPGVGRVEVTGGQPWVPGSPAGELCRE